LWRCSRRYDRGFKFTAYQSIASFQEYVLVAQDRPHITRYVRQTDGQWLRSEVEGLEGVLELVSVPCALALSDVYRFVNVPPRASEA
jgi:Uma2 family endonuclease